MVANVFFGGSRMQSIKLCSSSIVFRVIVFVWLFTDCFVDQWCKTLREVLHRPV